MDNTSGKQLNRYVLILAIFLLFYLPGVSHAQQIEKDTLWSSSSQMTYLMSRKYGVEKNVVTILGKMLENDDDVSVCLYLYTKSSIHPQDIMGLKRKGMAWKQIMKSLKFDADKLFTEAGIYEIFGVPQKFKHSYGELKKWQKDPSHEMNLTDDDVRDLVQLGFLVRNSGIPPINIMRERNAGASWTNMILNRVK
ncbi:MAG: hypothetical protein K8T10_05445 [Candidatus Eremiobacteraeota bacterium]|nr:hypothetical protein [Candidatus Eremiobacteraeota bacterium]